MEAKQTEEQSVSVLGTLEPESQITQKKSNRCKIISGALILCLLLIILALAFSLSSSSSSSSEKGDGELWLQYEAASLGSEKPQCPSGFTRSPLILVSLDGFRAEYLKDHGSHLPVITKLRAWGTTTPHLRPMYPTKTFPNHYSIVTGLYPESHGIVDNKMYDVNRNAFFSLKTEEKFNPKWYQGEPVWITAKHHKLKTGTFFWPGSDVAINGSFPDFYKIYDKSTAFETRVSTLFEWLDLAQEKRPDLYTLYLEEPDSSGHRYGPASTQVIDALKHVDRIMGTLMDGLIQRNLLHCVNIIISSDHGMEEASCERAVFVSPYLKNTDDFTVIQGPAARIRPSSLPDDFFSFDYEGLMKNLSCRTPEQQMRPYLKEHLPKRLHFANNVRIERGHLYMEEGWQAALNRKEIKYCTGGFHGSDNVFTNMQAIFIGYGPGFKSSTVVPPFENIELYNLMCDLLGVPPAPNNGTHGSLNHLLKRPVHFPVHPAQLSHDIPCETSNLRPIADLNCSCQPRTTDEEEQLNRLMINRSDAKATLRRLHHPFGVPSVVLPDATFCLLHQTDYVIGYSQDRHMALWVSYTVPRVLKVFFLAPSLEACVRVDPRIPPATSQTCDNAYGLLHYPSLNGDGPLTDSLITSNMVPMFPAFKDVWVHFQIFLLPNYAEQLDGLNVLSGPIFDEDYNGKVDAYKPSAPNEAHIPTHFFVILTSCGNSTLGPSNCKGPLRVRSFILPHRADYTESCSNGSDFTWVEDWMQLHTARVRDIELLTGLSFYHDRLSVEETLQLKTFLHSA
ncbi:ectonucleotide pyrophosphatase/phosphodiesterase family member 1 isoform X1 [Dunckerocampus dactyliophorus]|uniref:ectonucleotide pyrophosphatase/phosphodiesterase family member 1 isoform X1 n=1 Tax=Dunckerocampus dactyliophorus TaxID=161453 RepID=UPI00240590AA|nr:ectonucleotide pyrophosphatase/phosphodiesterase family member 1 isoform X1 [Dunckerocampus dactyliophorus]XP_054616939.1 ectonucleotide pyrophosphatase/phosphodiesterase family member 1 isoform X1 [Dunckerocampus dactyliophorus]XP_054616942.1 ectonucleotide pyrophosphatase/phosphodiesterase family member 1 isoform X1 [Dunckerocampus dactyliophorus]